MVPKAVQDLIWKHCRPGQEIDKQPTIDYIATAFVSISCVALKEGKWKAGVDVPLDVYEQIVHDLEDEIVAQREAKGKRK